MQKFLKNTVEKEKLHHKQQGQTHWKLETSSADNKAKISWSETSPIQINT